MRLRVGDLVRHSDHYRSEHCIPGSEPDTFGIVTQVKIFGGDPGETLEYWPRVHWQGSVVDSLCHPLNVTLVPRVKEDL